MIDQFVSLRRARQLTQEELNDRIGMADRLVSKWECGVRSPKVVHMCYWADGLNAKLILTPYDDLDPWPLDMNISNDNFLKAA